MTTKLSVCPGQVITAAIPFGSREPVFQRAASLLPGGMKQEGATWAQLFPRGSGPGGDPDHRKLTDSRPKVR